MLLRLQAAGVDIDQPRKLRQPDHALDRAIGHMRLAVERHHVVLAMRREADVADQHEIVIGLGFAKGAGQRIGGNFAVALIKLVQRRDDALWRADEPFAGGILADIGDQRAHRGFGLVARGPIVERRRRGADVVGERSPGPGFDNGWLDNGVHHFSNRRHTAGTSIPLR